MDLNIKTIKKMEEAADFVALSINRELSLGKKVLWFVCGGSAIPLEVLIAQKIKNDFSSNLTVTLTDERFGPVGHPDSNWFLLENAGFKISGAKMIPFLYGLDMSKTTNKVQEILKKELDEAQYKIGVFGIGIDSHTAGILPNTLAVDSNEIIYTYETDLYDRITITPKTILMLDQAVVYAFGEFKWPVIEKLEKEASLNEEPAQVLKKVPLLTIFSDFKNK